MEIHQYYCLPSPARDSEELKSRFTPVIQTVDSAMRHRMWLRITSGLFVFHLNNSTHNEIVECNTPMKLCFLYGI